MTAPAIVELPAALYDRVQRLAQRRQQAIPELIAEALDFAEENAVDFDPTALDWAEPDEAVNDEQAAYHRLHPHLWATYPNHYVAILGGLLVDHDINGAALSERIEQLYPDQFVLIRRVEQAPERILYFRSPRLERAF